MTIVSWAKGLLTGKPHFVIGDPARPYMLRWYLVPRNRWLNVYLHKIERDDDDRALHDHPWYSVSLCLSGELREHRGDGTRRVISRGSVAIRPALHRHRLEVISGPVWTLFLTGRKVREWGFWCPKGFVVWTDFVKQGSAGEVGRGCDQ